MQETHKTLYNSIKNIHYFLEKKEYSQVLGIYYTIFKPFTRMDSLMYSKMTGKNIKNISKEITMVDFIGKRGNVIDKYNVELKNVIFEITETAAIKDIELAKDFIDRFKSKGFKFALDNFGIGIMPKAITSENHPILWTIFLKNLSYKMQSVKHTRIRLSRFIYFFSFSFSIVSFKKKGNFFSASSKVVKCSSEQLSFLQIIKYSTLYFSSSTAYIP
jgi:hypothetical protein